MSLAASNRHTWRLKMLAAGLLIATSGIAARLFYLQIIDHDRYVAQAQEEHAGYRQVYAPRGAILDRNGHPLAASIDTFDVYIDRRVWRDETVANEAAQRLAAILHVPAESIRRSVGTSDTGEHQLIKALEYEAGNEVEAAIIPGVKVVPANRRIYPEGNLAAALIGFIGKDPVGLSGIEADFDELLAGKPGTSLFERDSLGNDIVIGRREITPPEPGPNLVLTIDRSIQRLVEEELDRTIAKHEASGGDIIVMDPQTGAILAMATRPSFNLLRPDVNGEVQLELFRNRSISDLYEPGSVFKLITMAAGIDTGIVSPGTTYFDAGVLQFSQWEIKNFDERAYGTQSMTAVLQYSLNTGAAWVAQQLGATAFYEYVTAFGFAEPTHAGLAGEASGSYRTPDNDTWAEVDLATNSFGQGIAITPLQIVTAVSAIVNGGNLMRPYVVQEITGAGRDEVTQPKVVRRVISEEASRTMREMMRAVVEDIPGHLAQIAGYDTGGKTGTADISTITGYDDGTTIASFVGVVPADAPRFVMLVKIDGPRDDEFGSTVAAPVFGRLAPRILQYLKVPPEGALAAATEAQR